MKIKAKVILSNGQPYGKTTGPTKTDDFTISFIRSFLKQKGKTDAQIEAFIAEYIKNNGGAS